MQHIDEPTPDAANPHAVDGGPASDSGAVRATAMGRLLVAVRESRRGGRVRRAGTAVAAALLLGVFAARAILSLSEKSLTVDESAHIPAGLSYWRTGDFRICIEHPPLAKMIATVPLLFLDLDLATDDPTYEPALSDVERVWEWSRVFWYRANADRVDEITFLARLPMVLLGVLFCLLVFFFARDLFGSGPALLALFLASFCPSVIAHARLVATDLPVSLGIAFAVWRFDRFCRSPGVREFVLASLGAGFALASKYTGVLLFLVLPLLGLVHALARRPRRLTPLVAGAGIAACGLLLASLTYGLAPRLDLYWQGFRSIYAGHPEGSSYFLLGQYSPTGFRLYYPLAVAMKMPVGTLALVIGGLVAARKLGARAALVWVPVAVMFAAGAAATHNIGVRHVLPAYPFLFVGAGALSPGTARRRRLALAAGGLLVAWTAVSSVSIHPDYLAYFNEVVGGPEKGIYRLDDSNVDWGEDLAGLERFVKERGIDAITVNYFGPHDPVVKSSPMRPMPRVEMILPGTGWYAVSAHFLQRDQPIGLGSAIRFRWLERFRPVAVIGHSIYVYRFLVDGESRAPGFEGTVLERSNLLAQAEADCREGLERFPDDPYATYFLGTVRKMEGRLDEAIAQYGRALELQPWQQVWWVNLGRTARAAGNLEVAESALERASELVPESAEIHVLAAEVLAERLAASPESAERRERLRAHAAAARALGADLPEAVQRALEPH